MNIVISDLSILELHSFSKGFIFFLSISTNLKISRPSYSNENPQLYCVSLDDVFFYKFNDGKR
jgi:hypothetical protein